MEGNQDVELLQRETQETTIRRLVNLVETGSAAGVIFYRHEEPYNPEGKAYNVDRIVPHRSPTRSRDTVRLGSVGRKRLRNTPESFRTLAGRVVQIMVSPERRARETAHLLQINTDIPDSREVVIREPRLTDQFNPGPYQKGLTLAEYKKMKATKEGQEQIQRMRKLHGREDEESIRTRMEEVFGEVTSRLEPGQVGLLVTHEAPARVLLSELSNRNVKLLYGEAYLVVIDPDTKDVIGGSKIVSAPGTDQFSFYR